MRLPAWTKGALLLAMTFAAGLMLGVTWERRQAPSHHRAGIEGHDVVHYLERSLDLDATQRSAIREILARHQTEVDSAWHRVQPHVRATLDATHQEIEGVLRPDQAAKYRALIGADHSGRQH
jgi:hypothetical protein